MQAVHLQYMPPKAAASVAPVLRHGSRKPLAPRAAVAANAGADAESRNSLPESDRAAWSKLVVQSLDDIKLGSLVAFGGVPPLLFGRILFLGPTHLGRGIYVGLELQVPRDELPISGAAAAAAGAFDWCNGTCDGVRYFNCDAGRGTLLPVSSLFGTAPDTPAGVQQDATGPVGHAPAVATYAVGVQTATPATREMATGTFRDAYLGPAWEGLSDYGSGVSETVTALTCAIETSREIIQRMQAADTEMVAAALAPPEATVPPRTVTDPTLRLDDERVVEAAGDMLRVVCADAPRLRESPFYSRLLTATRAIADVQVSGWSGKTAAPAAAAALKAVTPLFNTCAHAELSSGVGLDVESATETTTRLVFDASALLERVREHEANGQVSEAESLSTRRVDLLNDARQRIAGLCEQAGATIATNVDRPLDAIVTDAGSARAEFRRITDEAARAAAAAATEVAATRAQYDAFLSESAVALFAANGRIHQSRDALMESYDSEVKAREALAAALLRWQEATQQRAVAQDQAAAAAAAKTALRAEFEQRRRQLLHSIGELEDMCARADATALRTGTAAGLCVDAIESHARTLFTTHREVLRAAALDLHQRHAGIHRELILALGELGGRKRALRYRLQEQQAALGREVDSSAVLLHDVRGAAAQSHAIGELVTHIEAGVLEVERLTGAADASFYAVSLPALRAAGRSWTDPREEVARLDVARDSLVAIHMPTMILPKR